MTIPGWFLWAEAYLFVKMFELWVFSDIPFDFFDYFSPFRDEQFRRLCVDPANASRVHRACVNAAIQAEGRL